MTTETLPRPSLLQSYRLAFEDAAMSPVIACGISTAVILAFLLSSPEKFQHWFLLPLLVCGTLTISDLVDWVRSRVSLLDPIGILSMLTAHLFFLAPLLHVQWDYWLANVVYPPDWRDWIGGLSVLCALGLLAYRMVRTAPVRQQQLLRGTTWVLDRRRFILLAVIGMVIALAVQLYIYASKGGILGFITAYETRVYGDGLAGLGPLFMLAEPFPMLALMTYVLVARNSRHAWLRSWPVVGLVMILFFAVLIFFGGLRGSRSNTVFALFWAVGILHIWVRQFSRAFIISGIVLMLGFAYLYSFYKGKGVEGVSAVGDADARAELTEQTGRGWERVALRDLGRTDIQAYLLYKIMAPDSDYEFSWGNTYVGGALVVVPRSIWRERPGKVKQGTILLFGKKDYDPETYRASYIYGLVGEAMLNFGPFAIPLVFVLFGLLVRKIRVLMLYLERDDGRQLLIPFLIIIALLTLFCDLDNTTFFAFKHGVVPMLILVFSVKRRPRALPDATRCSVRLSHR